MSGWAGAARLERRFSLRKSNLMLTFFSTPKAFRGHIEIIQRNALESWKRLHSNIEVILFGVDKGTAEICKEFGLRHIPDTSRSQLGTNRVDSMFERAQQVSRHDLLCYSNCDIVLTQDFMEAVQRVRAWRSAFLMVGRRWDTAVAGSLDFAKEDWERRITELARREGYHRFYHNIDYFVFTRGLYREMPPLVVGRAHWDHWMVWKALAQGAAVVDASEDVCAVHQNHDYSHVPEGWKSVSEDQDAQRNFELAGGRAHLRTIEDATFRLTARGVEANRFYWMAPTKRRWRDVGRKIWGTLRTKAWHRLLDATRPLRHAVGLKEDSVPAGLRSRKKRHWMDV
jgi:hypothetical protein